MRYYRGHPAYRPISAWGYVGYSILFMIPVVGWIFLLVFTFSDKNINRRSFARSFWIWALILAVLAIVLASTATVFLADVLDEIRGSSSVVDRVDFPTGEGVSRDVVANREAQDSMESPAVEANVITESKGPVSSAASSDFVALMDSYEAFFDEYVDFMKNYDEDNMTDLGAYGKYASLMTQYADVMEKLDAIDEEELTAEEDAYYIEVMARINKKLLEVA